MELGTFFSYYYPYKDTFTVPFLDWHSEIQESLTTFLDEVSRINQFGNSPIFHTEKKWQINLTRIQMLVGVPGIQIGETLPEKYYYRVDTEDVISFGGYEGVVFCILKNGKTYCVSDQELQEEFLAENVILDKRYVWRTLGYLFNSTSTNILMLRTLLDIMRLGPTRTRLLLFFNLLLGYPITGETIETVSFVTPEEVTTDVSTYSVENSVVLPGQELPPRSPLSPLVRLTHSMDLPYFIHEKTYYEPTEVVIKSKFDSFKFNGGAQFSVPLSTRQDPDLNKIVYVLQARLPEKMQGLSLLDKFFEHLPLWLSISIHLEYGLADYIDPPTELVYTKKGKYIEDSYSKISDGQYGIVKFPFKFNTKKFNEYVLAYTLRARRYYL